MAVDAPARETIGTPPGQRCEENELRSATESVQREEGADCSEEEDARNTLISSGRGGTRTPQINDGIRKKRRIMDDESGDESVDQSEDNESVDMTVSDFPTLSQALGITARRAKCAKDDHKTTLEGSEGNIDVPSTEVLLPHPWALSLSSRSESEIAEEVDEKSAQVILAFTNIRVAEEKTSLLAMAEYLGAEVVEDVSNMKSITHLVTGVNRKGAVIHRSIKYMIALAAHKWIVRDDWLHKSAESGQWSPEEDQLPTEMNYLHRYQQPHIFQHLTAVFIGTFPSPEPPRAHLEVLIQAGGGSVISSYDPEDHIAILVLDENSFATRHLLQLHPDTTVCTGEDVLESVLTGQSLRGWEGSQKKK